jgi:glycosyl transferase, family 25
MLKNTQNHQQYILKSYFCGISMMIPSHINDFLKTYFDRVFVVSVPRFANRHVQLQKTLEGLDFDFFWGTDKLTLQKDALVQQQVYDEAAAKKNQRQGKALNEGEIACSLSHRSIYAAMVENNWQRVLILEDDVLPVFSKLELLPQAIKELPGGWDLVYLGYLKHEKITASLAIKQFFYKLISSIGLMKWSYTMAKNMLPRPYSTHLKKAGFHDCTHAYAISLQAAQKLLSAQSPVVYRADDLLSALTLKGQLNAFVTEPKFFDQEGFYSPEKVSEIKEGR